MDSLRVVFVGEQTNANLKLELDDVKNHGKTQFNITEECFLRLTPANSSITSTFTSVGRVLLVQKNLVIDTQYEETLTFQGSDYVTLSYKPYGNVTVTKIGNSLPNNINFVVEGDNVIAQQDGKPVKTYAIIQVKYYYAYDSYKCTNSDANIDKQLIVMEDVNGNKASITVNWIVGSKKVVIHVKDSCSKTNIEGAIVKIGSQWEGTTNEFGIVEFDDIPYGRHPIYIYKDGYWSNVDDIIANDYLDVMPDEG